MKLDYPNTCPIIDRGISSCSDAISSHVERLVESLFPMLDTLPVELINMVQDTSYDILQDVEREFEVVRSTNEGMRSAADCQIKDLCDELSELGSKCEEMED